MGTNSTTNVYDSDAETARRERGDYSSLKGPVGPARSDFDSTYRSIANLPTIADKDRNNAKSRGEDSPNSATQAEQAALGGQNDDDGDDDTLGRGFTGGGKKAGGRLRSWTRKRARYLAVSAGITLSGSAIIFATIGAPMLGAFHLIHWSELLQGISAQSDLHNQSKASRLYLHMATDAAAARTRLTYVSSKDGPKLLNKLMKSGYTITSSKTTGYMRRVSIVPSQTAEFRDMSDADVESTLKQKYGITKFEWNDIALDNDEYESSGTRYGREIAFNVNELGVKTERNIISDAAVTKRSSTRASAIAKRVLRAYYGVPNAFHPITNLGANLDRKFNNWLDRSNFLKELRKARNAKIAAREAQGKLSWNMLKEKVNGVSGKVVAVVMLQGVICGIRDNADLINNIQRDMIVVPGMLAAAQAMSLGDQITDGTDVTSLAIESAVQGLYSDKGYSVFDSKSVSLIEGKAGYVYANKDPTGQYTKTYDQIHNAFSGDTQLAAVVNFIDNNLGGGTICSPIGQLVGAGAGLLMLATGPGGLMTKGLQIVVGAGISQAIGKATLGAIDYYVTQTALDITDGPIDGDRTVYGAVGANDLTELNSGASKITPQQAAVVANEVAQYKAEQQKQKSIASRLFNPYDSDSLAGKIADSISPSISTNVASIISSFASIGKSAFLSPLSLLGSKAHAQTVENTLPAQRLGMPVISQQPAILAIADPFANADKAADLLDANAAAYQAKAKICYGVTLAKATNPSTSQQYWDVSYTGVPDTSKAEYINSNCDQVTSSGVLNDWGVITGLISYSHTMDALACGDAYDEEACAKLGLGTTVTALSTSTSTATGAMGPANGQCDPRTTSVGAMDGYEDGLLFKFTGCAIQGMKCTGSLSCQPEKSEYAIVNADVSTAVQDMFEAAKAAGLTLTATGAFRTMAMQQKAWDDSGHNNSAASPPGYSNHQAGRAIDFDLGVSSNVKEGATCDNRATVNTPTYTWLRNNSGRFKYYQYAREAWHFDSSTSPLRCTAP